jgi:hypothetical protein
MKVSLTRVGQILTKYKNVSGKQYPDTLELDFKRVVNGLPHSLLQPHIDAAFRSSTTPAISEIVASWYKTAKKTQKVRLFELLVQSGAMLVECGPPLSKAATRDLFSAKDVGRIISSAFARDPSVNTKVARLYAQTPKIMFTFDHGVRGEILKTLARETGSHGTDVIPLDDSTLKKFAPQRLLVGPMSQWQLSTRPSEVSKTVNAAAHGGESS